MIKKIFFVLLSFILFACNSGNVKVILETEGTEYKIMDSVSFYYPKDYKIDIGNEPNDSVLLLKDDEMLKYQMLLNDTDNNINDLPHLYLGQLEEDGAVNGEFSSIVLENELKCFEFTGVYSTSGIKFKHLVYFGEKAIYVYMYQAPENVYDNNINVATQYLRSLTVHIEQVS